MVYWFTRLGVSKIHNKYLVEYICAPSFIAYISSLFTILCFHVRNCKKPINMRIISLTCKIGQIQIFFTLPRKSEQNRRVYKLMIHF